MSTQTISDFPAGNYTFQYEWSAVGGSKQSCSNIRIQPFQWKVPPFDWTTITAKYFSEVPFKLGTIQTCWGYGGEIRLRSLKWMRKKGTCSPHLLMSHQDILKIFKHQIHIFFHILFHFEARIGAINPIHYRSATQIQLLMTETSQIIQYSEAVDSSVV